MSNNMGHAYIRSVRTVSEEVMATQGANTVFRTTYMEHFSVQTDMHHDSGLNPLLFIILTVATCEFRIDLPSYCYEQMIWH